MAGDGRRNPSGDSVAAVPCSSLRLFDSWWLAAGSVTNPAYLSPRIYQDATAEIRWRLVRFTRCNGSKELDVLASKFSCRRWMCAAQAFNILRRVYQVYVLLVFGRFFI